MTTQQKVSLLEKLAEKADETTAKKLRTLATTLQRPNLSDSQLTEVLKIVDQIISKAKAQQKTATEAVAQVEKKAEQKAKKALMETPPAALKNVTITEAEKQDIVNSAASESSNFQQTVQKLTQATGLSQRDARPAVRKLYSSVKAIKSQYLKDTLAEWTKGLELEGIKVTKGIKAQATGGTDIERDSPRQAKPFGKRRSNPGAKRPYYWENRANRADVKQGGGRPLLKVGGKLSSVAQSYAANRPFEDTSNFEILSSEILQEKRLKNKGSGMDSSVQLVKITEKNRETGRRRSFVRIVVNEGPFPQAYGRSFKTEKEATALYNSVVDSFSKFHALNQAIRANGKGDAGASSDGRRRAKPPGKRQAGPDAKKPYYYEYRSNRSDIIKTSTGRHSRYRFAEGGPVAGQKTFTAADGSVFFVQMEQMRGSDMKAFLVMVKTPKGFVTEAFDDWLYSRAAAENIAEMLSKGESPYDTDQMFGKGGKTKPFSYKVKKVADRLEGTSVPAKYQAAYGTTYDKAEAQTAATQIIGKQHWDWKRKNAPTKMAEGGELDYDLKIYKKGGTVKVEIVNKGEKFTKAKYQGILGDYDKDGIANADDSQPLTKEFSTVVDNPKFSTAFNSLLSIKKNMDKNMYGFIKELKTVSPPNSTIYARTKTPFSILNKLIQKRLQDARKGLTDLIGTTIVVDNQQTLYQVRDALLSGKLGEVIEFEDFYEKPQHGYRAFHFLIRYANSPVEVQVKTKRQKELNQLTHEPYKQNRLNKELSDEMTLNAVYADEGDRQAIAKHQAFMSGKNLEKAFFM